MSEAGSKTGAGKRDRSHRRPVVTTNGMRIELVGRSDGPLYLRFEDEHGDYLGSIAPNEPGFRRLNRWLKMMERELRK